MRIDVYLVEKGYFPSRSQASAAISEGRVICNGSVVTKPAFPVEQDDTVSVSAPEIQFVSRAGLKLEAALQKFDVSVAGKTVLDIGASTGGFTDCVLRRGAAYVYAVDVGSGQLHPSLCNHPLVSNREHTNARYLKKEDFDRTVDIIVTDVSFISQKLLYPAVSDILPAGGIFISLIKPQFEVGPQHVGKKGIVKDPQGKLFRNVLQELTLTAKQNSLRLISHTDSPILGGDGNHEYLAYFVKE